MVRFLVINDLHLSEKAPKGRKDDYLRAICRKLVQCIKLAKRHEIDAVLFTGDIFHRKYAVSHFLVRGVMKLFENFKPIPLYTVVGNHDIVGGNMGTLLRMPMSVLLESGVLRLLGADPVSIGPCDVYGVSYSGTLDIEHAYVPVLESPERVNIVVTHGMLLPPKRQFFGAYTNWDDLDLGGVSVLLNGHYHPGTGVKAYRGTVMANVGAISRVSRSKEDMERCPSVLLLTVQDKEHINTGKIKLKIEPAEYVMIPLAEHEDPEGEEQTMRELPEVGLTMETAAQLAGLVEAIEGFSPAVRDIVKGYIERAERSA